MADGLVHQKMHARFPERISCLDQGRLQMHHQCPRTQHTANNFRPVSSLVLQALSSRGHGMVGQAAGLIAAGAGRQAGPHLSAVFTTDHGGEGLGGGGCDPLGSQMDLTACVKVFKCPMESLQ